MIHARNGNVAGAESGGCGSDAQLAVAARRGDKRAFVEIVARHQAMVCGIALGILGDFSASEDAAQEAFLTAWRKIHELREPERLRAWLSQIARNAALGHLRRRRGEGPLEDAPALLDHSPTPDEAAVKEEEAALVRESLANLPETYRLPLVLYYREGQSVRAVAKSLEISEEAVRQRLSRGREMLRDRMSGLIETVLTRTGPTAVFTMGIAAAIGALAAPSVIAGSIFTTVSAATSTTSSATAAQILTAMSTSKNLLVSAALAAAIFVPVGFYARSEWKPAPESKSSLSLQSGTKSPISQIAPAFEKSLLFAEWQQLHDRYGRNSEAMPALYKAIAELKDPVRQRAFRAALIAEWVQVDAPGGFAFILGKGPDETQREQFLTEWLSLDPSAAIDALLQKSPGWEEPTYECLKDIARRAPSRLVEVVSLLPKNEQYYDRSVRNAFGIFAEDNPLAARKAAESVQGANREQALSGIARIWAKTDLNATIAWIKTFPDGTDHDEIIREALIGKATVDPVAALESAGIVPQGGKYAHSESTTGARVIHEAADTDFDTTVTWIANHSGRFGREDLMGLSYQVTERLNADPAGFLTQYATEGALPGLMPAIESALLNNAAGKRADIWEWLKTQPESDTTRSLRDEVLSSAGYQDPELAMRLGSGLPRTAEGDLEAKTVAQAIFNGGHELHRFENFYPKAPERLREPMLAAAFDLLSFDNLDDPQRWVSRLSLLPESSKPNGAKSVARAWASQSPQEAIGWAASLQPGESRNSALAAITSTWARKDAVGAAEWVSAMQPGMERDQSAQALAETIGDWSPRDAWDWAVSIQNKERQKQAALQVAKTMAARDLSTAREWIGSSPLSSEAKAELQAALGQKSPKKL